MTKHCPLKSWLSSKQVIFGALLETHVMEANKNHILAAALGPQWSFLSNYQFSDLRKIWIIYKNNTRARVLFIDLQTITCEIILEDNTKFIYTAVYASNTEEERKSLWDSLRDTNVAFNLSNTPWLVNGDFNEIFSPLESSNESIVRTTRGMRDFGACLADTGLFDLPFNGPKYTWTNNRPDDPIAKKLDRCLVNGSWLLRFPASHCTFESPVFSDHSPCHIRLVTKPPSYGTRPFRFFNLLTKHVNFKETVALAWSEAGETVATLKDFCFKLKKVKNPMKSLLKDNFSDIERWVSEADSILSSLQRAALNDPSEENFRLVSQARSNWFLLREAEESFFRQRSRIKWLGEGDLNTHFFHSVTITRNAGNAIKHLIRPDGSRTSSLQEAHELAIDYYYTFLTMI